jgi:multiple sugar transport system substrate-binding protein
MRIKHVWVAVGAAAMLITAGCSGGSGGNGSSGNGGGAGKDDGSLLVWTTEDQADRVQAQKAILDAWGSAHQTTIKLVTIAEDQLETVLSSAVAAGKGPDVIGALSVNGVNQLATDKLLDTDAAKAVVDGLGADTFDSRALELTRSGNTQLSVPSDGWAQLLFYRKDLLKAAGLPEPTTFDAVTAAAKALDTGGVAGIVAGTAPADSFTQQTFEQIAVANNCQLTDASGKVTLDSPQCQQALQFYADLIKNYSVRGNQDADTTRASYFAGKAAMVIWSSFMLDELAGLRNDALPTCPQCKSDRSFLVKNTGIVTALKGPSGTHPASFGEIVSWAILTGANPKAKDLVTYTMSDGYLKWLGIAPEGKLPTRKGTKSNPQEYVDGWQQLKAGVDKKVLLSSVYPKQTLTALTSGIQSFDRWGVRQGQGELAGAVGGQFVVPQVLAKMLNSGESAADAAAEAQKQAEQIKTDLS